MAATMYQRIWERILAKQVDFGAAGDTIRAILLKTTYTFDKDHDYVSDVVAHEVTGTGYVAGWGGAGRVALASKTLTLDDANNIVVFDSADPSWAGINLAHQIGGIALFVPKTADSDSPLICFDGDAAAGFPVTTSGGTYTHAWNASGIFKLYHP